ncbi:MAG: hypothetical protein PHE68_04810 [Candidatus Peribacteraceae bacterium]|nr:hypothetical protein [Candidatus Peribacteraceae bacterium]MDD5075259.1 hypothetical protein [Candidatus Peribacteraceae bacterium]
MKTSHTSLFVRLFARVNLFTIVASLILGPALSVVPVFVPLAEAASSGPNNGLTFANDSGVGTVDWSNPSNTQTSNDVYATTNGNAVFVSRYLKATGFGFNIPSGSTIDGIEVRVERNANSTSVHDAGVFIVKNGSITGADQSKTSGTGFTSSGCSGTGNCWTNTETTVTYGSSTDLWGATWTAEDINALTFGAAFAASRTFGTGNRFIYVDNISVTVYYSKTNQTITVTSSAPASAIYGSTFPVAATASSGLAVQSRQREAAQSPVVPSQ